MTSMLRRWLPRSWKSSPATMPLVEVPTTSICATLEKTFQRSSHTTRLTGTVNGPRSRQRWSNWIRTLTVPSTKMRANRLPVLWSPMKILFSSLISLPIQSIQMMSSLIVDRIVFDLIRTKKTRFLSLRNNRLTMLKLQGTFWMLKPARKTKI